jgi:hypothetical protein
MRYHVRMRIPAGSYRLVCGESARWEANLTVITWCTEQTREAAEAIVRDIRPETNPRHVLGIWIAEEA